LGLLLSANWSEFCLVGGARLGVEMVRECKNIENDGFGFLFIVLLHHGYVHVFDFFFGTGFILSLRVNLWIIELNIWFKTYKQ